jgi:hypothetical protein
MLAFLHYLEVCIGSLADFPQPAQAKAVRVYGPRLAGVWQKAAIAAWAAVFLLSLLSLGLSVYTLNTWDRIPAANLRVYLPHLTDDDLTMRADFQAEVVDLGFSLPAFAFFLTAARLVGGISLLGVAAMLVLRYPGQLMAVLLSILMSVMAAAGMWNETLFSWATPFAPWMELPTQLLNLLLIFGLILLCAFPDGRFTPRWSIAMSLVLIPLAISNAFDLNIFLNPNTWPSPLPEFVFPAFVAGSYFCLIYRYRRLGDPDRKAKYLPFLLGISLLVVSYFIHFLINDVYQLVTGQALFSTWRGVVLYVLIGETLWFLVEMVSALLVARSIFRRRLLES